MNVFKLFQTKSGARFYSMFVKEKFPQVRQRFPEKPTKELFKILGEQWAKLSDQQKQFYLKKQSDIIAANKTQRLMKAFERYKTMAEQGVRFNFQASSFKEFSEIYPKISPGVRKQLLAK